MPEIFCERIVHIDGHTAGCRFYQPEPDGQDFRCHYEIDWPEGAYKGRAYGVDAVQALLLAMQKAHTDLLAARENQDRQITWLDRRSLGMPIPATIADWAPDNEF
tara:strand:- start:601 stop:915 length:315 start_codon:yes stop_codon:yes gene_type:complete